MNSFHHLRSLTAAAGLAAFLQWHGAAADENTIDVVTSFSILGDMVAEVGGDRVHVISLVGVDEDTHVFIPGPSDVQALAAADLLVVNGLGFEGWLDRLVEASGTEATLLVATRGLDGLKVEGGDEDHDNEEDHEHGDADGHDDHADEDGHDHGHDDHADEDGHDHGHDDHADEDGHDHGHDDHADEDGHDHGYDETHDRDDHAEVDGHDDHGHGPIDPHAWQDVANAEVYVRNIAEALIAVDSDGQEVYEANAERYLEELNALDHDIRDAIADLPENHRTVVTSHDAFGYFERAYGITFLAAIGSSTDAAPSAGELAALIRQIREEQISAVFIESITDNRIIDRIAEETGAVVGGSLYSDALSNADGPAPTYIDMMRHNTTMLTSAITAF